MQIVNHGPIHIRSVIVFRSLQNKFPWMQINVTVPWSIIMRIMLNQDHPMQMQPRLYFNILVLSIEELLGLFD